VSRFVLLTDDAVFTQRVRAASGGMPGEVVALSGRVPLTPDELLTRVPGALPEVLLLGPGVDVEAALRFAAISDIQHPEISLLLVAEPDAELALAAMRSGIRDLLSPDAPADVIRVLLERASQASASRRRGVTSVEEEKPGGRVITVLSPKGGVGKTTIATNLAVGLGRIAPMGTVLVDLDAQFGDVASALRLEPAHTLEEAVRGAAASDTMVLKTFLSIHPSATYVLCAPHSPEASDDVTGERVSHMMTQLTSEFAYTVIDTAPGINEHALAALEHSTDVVLLCGMDVPSIRGLRKQMDVLEELRLLPASQHVVVNCADRHSGLAIRDIEATLRKAVDVVVPRSRAVAYSTNSGEPVLQRLPRDPATRALRALADRFDPSFDANRRRGLHRRAG
jgi:pilus assembly protein CpaE